MGLLVSPQAERRAQIRLQIGNLANVRNERLVHLLLVLYPLGINLLLLRLGIGLALLEEGLLALALLLLARPVRVLARAVQHLVVHARDVDDRLGRNDVAVVDAAQRHTVGFVGAGDEEDALRELAEENDVLAAEAAGEEDQDGAGLERLAVFGWLGRLAGLGCGLAAGVRIMAHQTGKLYSSLV